MAEIVMFKTTMPLDDLDGRDLIDQAITRLWNPSRDIEKDCRVFCSNLRDWLEVGKGGIPHWRRLAKTWEGFCATHIQKSPDFIDALMVGYELLDKDKAIPVRVALEAAKSRSRPELGKHGEHGKEQIRDGAGRFADVCIDNIGDNKPTNIGNAYLADRLRTQYPDVFEAMERGEYPSVHAASIAAGIRKPMAQHAATVEGFAKSIHKYLTDDEIIELIALLR